MGGLDRLEWTSIVPFIFWWLYPLGSASFFEGFAYIMKDHDKSRRKRRRARKAKKSNVQQGQEQQGGREVPFVRRGFSMYKYLRTSLIKKPPMWFFLIAWVVVYFLIGFSSWMYANWANDERPIFDAQFGLLWANFVVNILWVPLFFIFHKPILAYIDIWLVFITATAASVLRFVDATDKHGDPPIVWVSAGLFLIYPLWVLYALVLSTDILMTMWGEDYSKLGVRKRKI